MRPKVETEYVFLNRFNKPLTGNGVYLMLKRLARRAGVEGRFNPHSFRHGFAWGMLMQGASLDMVCDILGHSDIKVTKDFYVHWSQGELGLIHSRFSWLNKFIDLSKEEDNQSKSSE
jgi:integrase/recombinase XerD